jgi:hypothetical protein
MTKIFDNIDKMGETNIKKGWLLTRGFDLIIAFVRLTAPVARVCDVTKVTHSSIQLLIGNTRLK